jgi:phosphatidylserine synthase 2
MPPEGTPEHTEILRANTWRGIIAVTIFMCAFSYLNPFLDKMFDPYQRWQRIVVQLTLIYTCFIIFILHLRPDSGRSLFGFLDPNLNKPVTKDMHTYDDHCELTLEHVWDQMDHYFLVHWVDWFLASFVLRDAIVCHLWSILDEFLELSWQHILPHFRECWWDHILMDITLSNTPAIFLGIWCVRKFGIQEYDWLGRSNKQSFFDWEIFKCHRRFGTFCYAQFLLGVHFLTGFFIMNAFLIPPKHFFPISRLLLWFAFGNIGFKEGYEDVRTWNTVERKKNPVEGRHRWLVVAILFTEALIAYKYRYGTGNLQFVPTPFYVWGPWALVALVCFSFWIYLRFIYEGRTKKYIEADEVPKITAKKPASASKPASGKQKTK